MSGRDPHPEADNRVPGRDHGDSWPDVRLRRLPDRRAFLRRVATYEVERAGPAGPTHHRTLDPVSALTECGLPRFDARSMQYSADTRWDGGEGAWVGLPAGHRADPRAFPRIRVRRLVDDRGRRRYEVAVDDGPVEQHDADTLWRRLRRGGHPADDSPAVRTWDALHHQGDHTTWVDYITGGISPGDEPRLARLVRMIGRAGELLSASDPTRARSLADLAQRGRSASSGPEERAVALDALQLDTGTPPAGDGPAEGYDEGLLRALRAEIRAEVERLLA